MQKVISFKFDKGPKFSTELVKEETELTAEMIQRYDMDNLSHKHQD